jgi:hypothetical protein
MYADLVIAESISDQLAYFVQQGSSIPMGILMLIVDLILFLPRVVILILDVVFCGFCLEFIFGGYYSSSTSRSGYGRVGGGDGIVKFEMC